MLLTARLETDKISPQITTNPPQGENMLQEINTNFVVGTDTTFLTLSNAASDAVKHILGERKLEGYALRVYVAGGGCCGVNFGMALDNNFRDVDTTFEIDGVKVVVDEVSKEYLHGATIDYVNDPERGAGFAVNSPNAHGHEHGECGCGGSCSCQN
jgi:iron-sulfur cluster assembly accessory protein